MLSQEHRTKRFLLKMEHDRILLGEKKEWKQSQDAILLRRERTMKFFHTIIRTRKRRMAYLS